MGVLDGRSQYDAREIYNTLPKESGVSFLFLEATPEVLKKHFSGYEKIKNRPLMCADGVERTEAYYESVKF